MQEIPETLNIGDRVRVLCEDGVLVAEKISQSRCFLFSSFN
jgi:hypothetical protein